MLRIRSAIIALLLAALAAGSRVAAQEGPAPPAGYRHESLSSLPPKLEAFSISQPLIPARPLVLGEPLPVPSDHFDTGVDAALEYGGMPAPYCDPLLSPPDPYGLAPSSLADHKDTFFQKLDLQATWIESTAADDFSLVSLETYASFAVPLFTRDSPLVISPGFGVHYFEGPPAPHVPPRVYDTYLSLLWLLPLDARRKIVLEAKPGLYTDYQQVDRDSVRTQGKALLLYDVWPSILQVILGVAYLDRSDVNLLPVGGVIWTPTPNHRWELVFPQPKLAYRLNYWYDWDPGESFEDWIYLRGAFGGDQWEYQRLDGTQSTFLMRDYRVIVGMERKRNGGAGVRVEIGYLFGRALEFDGGLTELAGHDAAFLRGGVTF